MGRSSHGPVPRRTGPRGDGPGRAPGHGHQGSPAGARRSRFLRPTAGGRGAAPAALQRDHPRRGHRLRGRAPRARRPGRRAPVVRGRAPGVRPDAAPAAPPVGPPARRTGITPRPVPVHRAGTGRVLPARGPAGGSSGGSDPAQRRGRPTAAADTAWAAAAAFHATARAIRDPALRRAADTFDRAARAAYGKIPSRTTEGDRLRAAARLLAMAGSSEAGTTPTALHLAASLVRLAGAVGELRQAQQHAAQAAAARKAAEGLHAALSRSRAGAAALGIPAQARPAQTIRKPGDAARLDFPVPLQPGHSHRTAAVTPPRSHLRGQDLRRTLPRVRVRAGEPSQSSQDPPHRATASRSTRSRIRSFSPPAWPPGSSRRVHPRRPGRTRPCRSSHGRGRR